jgi:diaminopimelate decarboxylase
MEAQTGPIEYRDKELYFDGVKLDSITEHFRTPFYLYSENELIQCYQDFDQGIKDAGLNGMICFALKSNANPTLIKKLADLGSGADIVSGGELKRAIECKIRPQNIVFSGVGKTQEEIDYGIQMGIYSFNIESIDELELIAQRALHFNKEVSVAFRLNPKVKAKTHKHISTGFKTHKFGLLQEDIIEIAKHESFRHQLKLKGLSVHIGSQLTNLEASLSAFQKLAETANTVGGLEFLDVGGGLGVNYDLKNPVAPTISEYMNCVKTGLKSANINKVVFEPGRRIVASCGVFVTSVLRKKFSEDCHFIIVDGGMNDFVRPSLYEAYHEIYESKQSDQKIETDIVGPICETADCFGEKRMLSDLKAGDTLLISHTGAYGYSMASHYNLRAKPKELIISGHEVSLISKEHSFE